MYFTGIDMRVLTVCWMLDKRRKATSCSNKGNTKWMWDGVWKSRVIFITDYVPLYKL